jgi:long-chain acyl-CoA synthetase
MLDLRNTLRRPLRMFPNTPATTFKGQTQNYTEFHERVCRLANGLLDLGLESGDRVAVLMLNSPRFLELYYATMYAGLVIVPLNVRWGRQEFAFALSDCLPKVFAFDQTIYDHLKEHIETLKMLGITNFLFADENPPEGTIDYEALVKDASNVDPDIEVAEDDLIGLFYTSGTTSHPKGVMLTHKNLLMNAYHGQLALGFNEESIYLHAAPMFHLADLAGTFAVSWNGGTHAFVARFDEVDVLKTIEETKANSSTLIPTMINFLINHPEMAKRDVSSLDQILYGGSSMPADRVKQGIEVMKCRFQQGYGMTEAAPLVTALTWADHQKALAENREEILSSAGKPILGVDVRVVDDEDNDVPVGEVGEIIVRGPNVMKGYWNNEEATNEAMRSGWYHSKDMARIDADNYITIVDRKDDMIVTGGENVYSTEVETVLYEHPAIMEAAVIGVPDDEWIQALQAVVVLREGQEASDSEIIAFCKERLSNYKAPKRVVFTEELPKGGTGKILKNQLRAEYQK